MRNLALAFVLLGGCGGGGSASDPGDRRAGWSEPQSFQFGIYAAGADAAGMAYWVRPAGFSSAREYWEWAFRRMKEMGFDYATFNHNDPADLPTLLAITDALELPYLYEGNGFPSYYGMDLERPHPSDPSRTERLEVGGSFLVFPPESEPDSWLPQRRARRDRMNREWTRWIHGDWRTLSRPASLIGYTPCEEPPVDPMIDQDLERMAQEFRASETAAFGAQVHSLTMIYHWLDPLLAQVPRLRPNWVRAGFFGIGPTWTAGVWGENWWYAEDSMWRAYGTCAAVGARLQVFIGGAYEEISQGGQWGAGAYRRLTEGEMRAEVWLAAANGARGVEVFCFNSIDDGPPSPVRMLGLYDMRRVATDNHRNWTLVMQEVRPHRALLGALVPRASRTDVPYRRDPGHSLGASPIRLRECLHETTGASYLLVVNARVDAEETIDAATRTNLSAWSGGHRMRRVGTFDWYTASSIPLGLRGGEGAILEREP